MQYQRTPLKRKNFSSNNRGGSVTEPSLIGELFLANYNQNRQAFASRKLVFLFNTLTKVFDPHLIDARENDLLCMKMKPVPLDVREPVLNYVIDTIPKDYYGKYNQDRATDLLDNSTDSLVRVVKSGYLQKFSFFLSENILFISSVLNRGKVISSDWSKRPRINLEEFRYLNSQYFIKFGTNIPNFSLHLANIVEHGATLLMLSRSSRSVRTSSTLTKIERMFFWHSSMGDGHYKRVYDNRDIKSLEAFDLTLDHNVKSHLINEILKPVYNTSYYLSPKNRARFLELHAEIDGFFVYGPARPLYTHYEDNSRRTLPGNPIIREFFETTHEEIKKEGTLLETTECEFRARNSTSKLTKIGSLQVRTNLFRLYYWYKNLTNLKSKTTDIPTIRNIKDKIRICKILIFRNTSIFLSGRIENVEI